MIAIGLTAERLSPWYGDVHVVGTVGCARCTPLRSRQPIAVARAPRADFVAFFTAMRHFE